MMTTAAIRSFYQSPFAFGEQPAPGQLPNQGTRSVSMDQVFETFVQRNRLGETLTLLSEELWSDDPDSQAYVSPKAVENAKALINSLDPRFETPQVNDDDEGGVLLVWEVHDYTTILSIGDDCLDLVHRPGHRDSVHISNFRYSGAGFPNEIADYLIKKVS